MADLLEAGGLRLVEVAPPVIPAELRTAMDREWDAAVLANPALFDGRVLVTRFVLNLTSSLRTRLRPMIEAPVIWFSTRPGLTARPASSPL